MSTKYSLPALLIVASFLGCAGKRIVGNERCIENCKQPKWVNTPVARTTTEMKAFVGRSFKHSTERMALDYSKTNAWDEALTSMWGAYGKGKIREVCATAGVSADEVIDDAVVHEIMTEWKEKGLVKGDFVENHIERWERIEEAGVPEYYYKTYRLFLVHRDMVKDFLRDAMLRKKAEQEAEQTKRNIERALDALDRMQTMDFEDW